MYVLLLCVKLLSILNKFGRKYIYINLNTLDIYKITSYLLRFVSCFCIGILFERFRQENASSR